MGRIAYAAAAAALTVFAGAAFSAGVVKIRPPVPAVAPAKPSTGPEVWFEYGLASVLTGRLPNGQPVGLQINVVATGPSGDAFDEERIRARNRSVVPNVVQTLTTTLDQRVSSVAQQLEKVAVDKRDEQFKAARDQVAQEVGVAVAAMKASYNAGMIGAVGKATPNAAQYNLMLVMRSCDGTPGSCTLGSYATDAPNRSTDRFGKVYEWLRPGVGGKVNAFVAINEASRAPAAQAVSEVATTSHWKPLPDPATRILQLESAVSQARRSGVRLNSAVPEVVAIGQTSALRFVDVLSDPTSAMRAVPRDAGPVLGQISDELARARVTDCAKLRGKNVAAEALACAGYTGDATVVANCLAGKRCFPTYGDKSIADVLLLDRPASVKELIQQSANARLKLGPLVDVEKTARECAKKAGTDTTARVACLVASRSSPADKATIECAQRVSGNPTPKGILACLPAGAVPAATRAQIDCALAAGQNGQALALCAAAPLLSPEAREIMRCAEQLKVSTSAGLTCLALKSNSPDAQAAAACVEKNGKNWQQAALCTAASRGNLPPQAKKAIECAQAASGGGNPAANVGLCLVGDQLPGDVGKVAQCYVTGGGNPMAMGVCMASDGLTPDQRIALQCAAQSGGVPATWAVCTGGQLAWKEFQNCRGRGFAEDKCFGSGNDLRKFAEAISGSEIGPHSVVADVVNVYIKVAEFYVDGGEAVIKGAQHVVGEVGKVLEDQRKKAEKVLQNPGKAASDCARTPLDCIR